MQTSHPGVYACGDITGFSLLAHTAIREGEVAVNHILGIEDKMNYDSVPGVVYTNPELAGAGKTEEELKASGTDYHEYWRNNGKFVPNVTVRLASGGYIGGGLYHSQTIEGALSTLPGARIVYPSFADDAAGLLRTSMCWNSQLRTSNDSSIKGIACEY